MSLSGPERSVTSFLAAFLQLKVLAASDIARRVDCQDCQVGSCHCQHLSVTSFFRQPHNMHSSGIGCSICNWRNCSGGLQGCQGCLDPAPCNARYAMVENMSDMLLCNNCNKNPSDMLHFWLLTKHNNQTQHI